jgi:hypothetical protein
MRKTHAYLDRLPLLRGGFSSSTRHHRHFSARVREAMKMAWLLCLSTIGLLAAVPAGAIDIAVPPPHSLSFRFEPDAQRHCPADTVVWLDVALSIYNRNDERWYGRTRDGVFMCLEDADTAGYRAARRTN